MRRWLFAAEVMLAIAPFTAFAQSKAAKAPAENTFTIEGTKVKIPSDWSACKVDSDCVSVRAPCADVRVALNQAHHDEAKKRFDKACEHSNKGYLAVLKPPDLVCKAGTCANPNEIGDILSQPPK